MEARTATTRSRRFSGVGSGPLPGKLPSIIELTVMTLQPSASRRYGAASDCAPFPGSTTTLSLLSAISFALTLEIMPFRYVLMTEGSGLAVPTSFQLALFADPSWKIFSILCSSSLETSTPSGPITLTPLYCDGLCDAVIITEPLYPSAFVANWSAGVGTMSASAMFLPELISPAVTEENIIWPVRRPSLPTRISPSEKYVPMLSASLSAKPMSPVTPGMNRTPLVPKSRPWGASTLPFPLPNSLKTFEIKN